MYRRLAILAIATFAVLAMPVAAQASPPGFTNEGALQMSKTAITPTVGRVVLFNPAGDEGKATNLTAHAAVISFVHEGGKLVNVAAFTAHGNSYGKCFVPLLQDGEKAESPDTPYAEWMPYQKAVASGELAPTLHATT